ncbi:5-hydroxytryptamine receptor 3B [Amia ocellicauda]|uniref:5-hydroxytryptamine receptor 3B n=1 Tax=Amia ocellicauda TaxID=2972642 RepID=UPI0034648950
MKKTVSPVTFLLLLLSVPLTLTLREKPKRSTLNQLTRKLLRGYSKGVRPVRNWTRATVVYIDLILQAMLDVDGQNQKMTTSIWYRQIWNDEFLVWDPAAFDGINEISLSSEAIWVPDIIISEFVDVGKSPDLPYIYVNSSGTVKNYKPIQVVSACDLEIYAFPFDKQNCTLTFRSWLHTVNEVDMALWRSAEERENDIKAYMNDGEWELISVPSSYKQLHMESRDYAQIQFNVVIRRRPLLYVVSLLIPSIFLMVVDVISFYLPPDSGTRIIFKASILLGYTVFRVNMTNELPATAIKTPLIGVFFAVSMAMLALSLAKSIFVVKLLHLDEETVREKSVSACLLDKYGSASQSFMESSFTSMKTLEDVDQSGGYEFDFSPDEEEEEVCFHGEQDRNLLLDKVLQEVTSLRCYMYQMDEAGNMKTDWLALCYKVDKLLFRLYLFILVIYTSTLVFLWLAWSSH